MVAQLCSSEGELDNAANNADRRDYPLRSFDSHAVMVCYDICGTSPITRHPMLCNRGSLKRVLFSLARRRQSRRTSSSPAKVWGGWEDWCLAFDEGEEEEQRGEARFLMSQKSPRRRDMRDRLPKPCSELDAGAVVPLARLCASCCRAFEHSPANCCQLFHLFLLGPGRDAPQRLQAECRPRLAACHCRRRKQRKAQSW